MNPIADSSSYFSLADNIFFVLFVYLLVIGVWSAACNHDFISAKWKSVKKTRRRGLTHFFVITLPMAYILAYICIQSKSGDFKEVGAAAVALCFAWLHLSRTFWGLWQLYEFKRWATEAIRSINSLGFDIGEKSAQNLADEIEINDTIIDNRLMEGLVRCNLRFVSPKQVELISSKNSHFTQLWLYFGLIFKGIGGIFQVIAYVLMDHIHSKPFFENTPYIEPLEPEELWLRWASVLVADAIPEWLDSVRFVDHESLDLPDFNRMRDQFAEEILHSAAFHVSKGKSDDSHAFLSYETMKKFDELSDGKFSKYEFLRKSILTGNGLPFNAPHYLAFDDESGKYCYGKFESKLRRIVDALPADRNENVMNLGINEIEWLAVFLSLKTWTARNSSTDFSKDGDEPEVDESHFPVVNLSAQLGFVEKNGSRKVSQHFNIPFHKYSKRSLLWGNRNLLECSLHIDNWIAITAGGYIKDMIRHSNGKSLFSSWSFEYNKKLEYDRSRFQQLFMAPFENHFEQTLTFLGCSMECLRTMLAKWTVRNVILQRSEWNPKLKNSYNIEMEISEDFKDCLNSLYQKSDMESMYFRMRLLWELQNSIREQLIYLSEGPSSERAFILCILSYPAISIDIVTYSPNEESSVSIKVEEYDDEDFRVSHFSFKIKAEGLPDNCEILVSIINDEFLIKLIKSENYLRFSWEDWRNSFQGRLAGLRQWQWENWCWSGIENTKAPERRFTGTVNKIETTDNLLRSGFPITSGISRVNFISAGTGDCLTIWKGWLPHRRNMCHFELLSEGLIKTRNHLGYETKTVRINGEVMEIKCPQVQYQTVSYEKCDRESLQRSTVISAAAILDLSNGNTDDDRSSSSLGASLRKMGDRVTQADNYNFTVSITMLETAAVYYGDFQALEIALSMLKRKDEQEQASTLIELYFYSQFSPKNQFRPKNEIDDEIMTSMISRLRNFFEDCVRDSNYSSSIAERYAQFCLCLSSSGHKNCIGQAKLILQRVFLRAVGTAFTADLLQCIKLYCDMLVRTEIVDDMGLEGMVMSKMREYARSISEEAKDCISETKLTRPLKYLRNRISRNGMMNEMNEKIGSDIEFALAVLFQERSKSNSDDIKLSCALYESAADKGHVAAAYNYAIILQKGKHGVEKDPSKAKELYEKAARAGNFRAAFNVARLLQRGDTGVEPNPKEAIKYYYQAMDAGYMKAAVNLGKLYKKGADGMNKDVINAITLLSKASDARSIRAMLSLAEIHLDVSEMEYFDLGKAIMYLKTAVKYVKDLFEENDFSETEEKIREAEEQQQNEPNCNESLNALLNIISYLKIKYQEANDPENVK